jgi:hypothetical protein
MGHTLDDYEDVSIIYKDILHMDVIATYNHNSSYSLILPRKGETVTIEDIDYIAQHVKYDISSKIDGYSAFALNHIIIYLEKQ